jgi:hypothetical protein
MESRLIKFSNMCITWLKNLFSSKPPVDYQRANKVLVTNCINDYPGDVNDLNGCLFDQSRVIGKLPDFQKRLLSDYQVTKKAFLESWEEAITESISGDMIVFHYSGHGTQVKDKSGDETDGYDEALYLYDGVLIDDEINEVLQKIPEGVTVLILMDSCFSGGITRSKKGNPCIEKKSRFVRTEKKIYRKRRKSIARGNGEGLKWIVISGCGENQTSADANFNGQWAGAFTTYAMATLDRRLTYREWFNEIRKYLPSTDFDQAPTLEGPDYLLDKLVLT